MFRAIHKCVRMYGCTTDARLKRNKEIVKAEVKQYSFLDWCVTKKKHCKRNSCVAAAIRFTIVSLLPL